MRFLVLIFALLNPFTGAILNNDPYFDFKLVSLYFADSILKGMNVGGEGVEGANFYEVWQSMSRVLAAQSDPKLTALSAPLRHGSVYYQSITALIDDRTNKKSIDALNKGIEALDKELFDTLKNGQEITIPAGWPGHAVVLNLAPSQLKPKDGFDLRVFNLGDGCQFHQHVADPQANYPSLVKPWVSYTNIPWGAVETVRFFVLGLMNLLDSTGIASHLGDKAASYFYNEFLANFAPYYTEADNQLFVVSQRSGTCTVSSLMARVLFSYHSVGEYMRARVQVGLHLLKNFYTIHLQKNSPQIKMMSESGVEFKKILNFVLAALAKDAFSMLDLKAAPRRLSCYPTTKKLKTLIEEQNNCDATISKEDQKLLQEIAVLAVQVRDWLKGVKLDLTGYSTNFDSKANPGRDGYEDNPDINIENSFDFAVKKGPLKDLVIPPSPLSIVPEPLNERTIYTTLKMMVSGSESGYFCANLIELFHKVDLKAEPVIEYSVFKADNWRELYFDLLSQMGKKSVVQSMDCVLSFQKLAFYVWKLAVALDKCKGDGSQGLAEYAPPFTSTCNWKLFTFDGEAYRQEMKSNRLPMFSINLAQEKNDLCSIFTEYSKDKKRQLFDSQFVNDMKRDSVFQNLLISNSIEPHENEKIQKIIECAQFEYLKKKFPELYLAKLISATNERSMEIDFNTFFMVGKHKYSCYYACSDKYIVKLEAFSRNCSNRNIRSKTRYMNQVHQPLIELQNEFTILNEIEHVNSAWAFKSPETNFIMDKLLYSSEILEKFVVKRPKFGEMLVEAFGDYSSNQIKTFNAKCTDSFTKNEDLKLDLEVISEFTLIFARLMHKLMTFNVDLDTSITKQWTQIYKFWLDMSGFSKTLGAKLVEVIDVGRMGRIHLLLAYLASLTIQHQHLKGPIADFYESSTEASEDLSALLAAHHLMAENSFQASLKEEYNLLDSIFRSKVLMRQVLTELKAGQVNKEVLKALLQTALKVINGDIVTPVEDSKFNDPDVMAFQTKEPDNKSTPSKYLIQVSVGAIYLNDVLLISKQKFINNQTFLDYFASDLQSALSGRLTFHYTEVTYTVKNFLAKGADYNVILSRTKPGMIEIYRKISLYGKSRYYRWVSTSSQEREELDAALKMLNMVGLEVYYLKKKTEVTIACAPRNSNEIIYHAVSVKNLSGYSTRPEFRTKAFTLSIPVLGLREMNYFCDSESGPQSVIPPIIERFASKSRIIVYKLNEAYFAVIRAFSLDTLAPIVFKLENSSKATLVNDSNFVLHSLQVMNKDEPFTPALIVEKANQSKSFVALIPDLNYNSLDGNDTYFQKNRIQVKKIEIKSNFSDFNPQNRIERLLLAYHNLRHWNFKEAKSLLNRDSIHHNSPFNEEESNILTKIATLQRMNHPEGLAIMLMAVMHLKLNEIEALDTKDRLYLDTSNAIFMTYLMSMRDVSNKYYIHSEFPELVAKGAEFFNFRDRIMGDYMRFELGGYANLMACNKDTELQAISTTNVFESGLFINVLGVQLVVSLKNQLDEKVTNFLLPSKTYNTPIDLNFWNVLLKLRPPTSDDPIIGVVNQVVRGYQNEQCRRELANNLTKYAEQNKFTRIADFILYVIPIPESCKTVAKAELPKLSKKIGFRNETTKLSSIFKNMANDLTDKSELRTAIRDKSLTNWKIATPTDVALFSKLAWEIETKWFGSRESPTLEIKPNEEFTGKILNHLSTAIAAYQKERRFLHVDVFKNSELLTELSEYLPKEIGSLKDQIKAGEDYLTKITSDPTKDSTMTIILSFMDKIFQQKKDKVFSSLYSCYFSGNPSCFSNKFPHLSLEEVTKLQERTFLYYAQKNLLSYYVYTKKLSDELEALRNKGEEGNSFAIQAAARNLLSELKKIADFNGRVQEPGILNFEFQSGSVRLRQEQVNDVLSLTAKDTSNNLPTSTVIQRMMAAGKTFVLGTLASVLKADGKTLSILVPPSSLYQSNALSMQERTLKYFKSRGKTFHFQRLYMDNHAKNVRFLSLIIDRIEKVIKNRDYLIMDPSDLAAFHNSFLEYLENLQNDPGNDDIKEVLELHAKIYNIFKEKTSIILDEIDMTMDPKLELNYPTKDTEKMNMEAASLTADLILFTVFSEKVREFGLDLLLNNQVNFSQSKMSGIKELWKGHVEEKLSDDKGIWYRLITRATQIPVKELVAILFDPALPDNFEAKMKSESESLISTLITMRMQVHHWIPESLNGAVFEKFGPSIANWQDIKYAIPYVSANTPNERSVFADRWETLNKTLLMYTVKPFTFEEVSALSQNIANWKSKKETKEFHRITNIHTTDLNFDSNGLIISHRAELEKVFGDKTDPRVVRLIFIYVLRNVMEPIEYFNEQITCNALNMTSMFGSVQGYSGTIDNINTLPWQLVLTAAKERLENEKNNGGIIAKMLEDKEPVVTVKALQDTAKRMFSVALADANEGEFNAFVDIGAFFKAFTNVQVARAVFKVEKLSHIEAVIFYDEQSNQTRFIKKSNPKQQFELPSTDLDVVNELTKTKLEERFTFYDQRHITGSDITQHPTAKALLSIGPKVLLREILQGTLRLRQFMASQRARFVTTESVKRLLENQQICQNGQDKIKCDQLDVKHLIALSASNEESKQSRENIKLAFAKIDNEVRNFVLEALAKEILERDAMSLPKCEFTKLAEKFKKLRSIFIRSSRENPTSWIKKNPTSAKKSVLEQYMETKIKEIESSFSQTQLATLQDHIKKLIGSNDTTESETYSLQYFLDAQIPTSVASGEGAELQLELLTEVNLEVNLETDLSLELSLKTELDQLAKAGSWIGFSSKSKAFEVQWLEEYLRKEANTAAGLPDYPSDTLPFYNFGQVLSKLKKAEQDIFESGLGNVDFIFFSKLFKNCNSPSLLSSGLKAGEAFVYAEYEDKGIKTEKLVLLCAWGLQELFEDLKSARSSPIRLSVTDMAGRYIGPSGGPGFLIKQDLFEIPGFKENHMESFFKAHLFNGGMNYIFTIPELREQFGKWLRSKDLSEGERTTENMVKRLRYLALKLKGINKDECIFEMKTDPFIRILYGILANADIQMYQLLKSLFPENMDQQTAALKFLNFSAKTKENLWKNFDPVLFAKKFKVTDGKTAANFEEKRVSIMGTDYDIGLPLNQLQMELQDDSDDEEEELFDGDYRNEEIKDDPNPEDCDEFEDDDPLDPKGVEKSKQPKKNTRKQTSVRAEGGYNFIAISILLFLFLAAAVVGVWIYFKRIRKTDAEGEGEVEVEVEEQS